MTETLPIQSMPPLLREDLNKAVEDIVASYETKIENINSFFETTHLILSELQGYLLNTKEEERNQINGQLQDLLAKNEHLRRTDFDQMMQGISTLQIGKEKEIRDLVNSFLTEQKQMVNLLRDNFIKIKQALTEAEEVSGSTAFTINPERNQRIKESQRTMADVLVQQDKRKLEVSLKLKEFQKEQREMTQVLLELLAKGRNLRIKDLKSMLKEFDIQHKQRLALKAERKTEVQKRKGDIRDLLAEFKKKRRNLIKKWRINLKGGKIWE